MATCAFLSFRLGLDDGVSIVAATWAQAIAGLGFDIVTVAAEGPVDRIVPGLAISATTPPTRAELDEALHDVDLVVVENLLSIPLNLPASLAVAEALAGRPALIHHHDPPWQRERFAHVRELPVDDPAWRHVTINRRTEAEFHQRGVEAVCIYNGFDTDPPPGDRAAARAALGVGDHKLVVHPARAIARKDIPAAVALTETLGATYWLTGAAEEGYDDELERILRAARCPVIHRPMTSRSDLYAAADLVAFPSLWEGFGNPPVEAAIHRVPVAVSDYPVAAELRSLGFQWPRPNEIDTLRDELTHPDTARLDHNEAVARAHLSTQAMAASVERLFNLAGWGP